MSFEICNRCSVRNCRRTPNTTLHGRGECPSHKGKWDGVKMLDQLFDDCPDDLEALLNRANLSAFVNDKGRPIIRRMANVRPDRNGNNRNRKG